MQNEADRRAARIRGLRALHGPDPLNPGDPKPWLSLPDAKAIVEGTQTIEGAWAHYCMLEAFKLQRLVNAYIAASTRPPT